eukprot:CAMPEP_0176437248 /NCGR_PEP_ID=MMETSP0127-20121128/18495_1 /TAXON_ID=938130 /ORGANISM="Platyophrya macrostoma, Strain WH" /LENGTH=356 /DNA_ID=CAMNT_0017820811 /DNA_START=1 /DNA_END=1071 /DNA_ORIENTATION=+
MYNFSSSKSFPKNSIHVPRGNRLSTKILVLDLDETLITCQSKPSNDQSSKMIKFTFDDKSFYICKRPGLEEFLVEMLQHYTLVLYTTGTEKYASAALRVLGIDGFFSLILHRDHCQVNSHNKLEKDLSILAASPGDLILVDDSFSHFKNQPDNILLIKPFDGKRDDCELSTITNFLVGMSRINDVRPVMETYFTYKQALKVKNCSSLFRETEESPRGFTAKFKSESESQEFTNRIVIDIEADILEDEDDENSDGSSLALRYENISRLNMPMRLIGENSTDYSSKTLDKSFQFNLDDIEDIQPVNYKRTGRFRNMNSMEDNFQQDYTDDSFEDFLATHALTTNIPKSLYSKFSEISM